MGAIRLDANHMRLVLVDPGYIDPQDRQATIRFQRSHPSAVVDILENKPLVVDGAKLEVTVPAGSMRFIDLTYEQDAMS